MKFSAVLAWASLAFAAPTPAVEERSIAVLDTFVGSIKTLEATVKTEVDEIVKIAKIGGADDVIISEVKGHLSTIITTVTKTTGTITKIATNNPIGALQGLTQVDVTQLLGAVNSVNGIVSSLKAVVETIVKDLPGTVKAALQEEINKVKGLLFPLLQPVLNLVGIVEGLAHSLGLSTNGLADALSLVLGLVNTLSNLLQLPDLL